MGCGKSSVGIRLAQVLQQSFLDTDEWIEKKQGTTISEIFAKQGEEAFREMETQCLLELLQESEEGILSLGGGLPIREKNRQLLKQLGKTIYLKAKPETIYERLKGDTTRPLLQTENPQEKIRQMIATREEVYMAAADIVIVVDGKKIEDIVQEIVKKISEIHTNLLDFDRDLL